ncbi:MAG: restriction endonuclease subunit S [Methanomethylovorans sp.]|nr:restriction endonuclease subunit S [Methanomethylovorans sp.]
MSSMGKGGTQRNISQTVLKTVDFPLPPLPEQRAIVSKIEQLFSDLDNGIANLRLAQEQLKVYRQAVLKKAFEGELTRKWREQQTDLPDARDLLEQIRREREEAAKASGRKVKLVKPLTEDEIAQLPGLPEGWGWVKIADVSKVGTGVTPLKKRIDFYKDGTIPWVTSGALNEAYVKSASNYVTDIALKETNLKIYPKYTLLVALYGEGKTRGKCSELLIEATTNQAIAAIVQEGTEEEIRSYLKLFLMKNYDEIRMKSSGGVQPNLNLGIIENTSFPLCSLPEQHAIVEEIETRLSVCDKMAQDIDEALEKAEALRQSILKKAFEGKLLSERELAEVRRAEDWEPAEVLLERIRAERVGNGKK